MNNKYNPIRQCSCFQCRHSYSKRYSINVAQRKFRQQSRIQLKEFIFNPNKEVDKILVDAGYFS